MKRNFNLNDIVSKLTREEMKCIRGGSQGSFPDALYIVECNNGSLIGTSACCPPPSFLCGDSGIKSYRPNK